MVYEPSSYQDYLAYLDSIRKQQGAQPGPTLDAAEQQKQGGGGIGGLLGAGALGYGGYKGISSLFGSGGSLATPGNVVNAGISTPTGVSATVVPETAGFMGTAAPILGGLAALHGGYGLAKNFGKGDAKGGALSGLETGAGIGTMIAPGFGTLLGGGIGLLGGGLLGSIKTGKHEDQVARDQVRAGLQKAGFLDEGFNVSLADGSKFNIGLDGGATNASGGHIYNVDESNKFSAQASGWGKPIALALTGGNPKLSSDFGGYLANAAMSNAQTMEGVRANMLNFMQKAGLTPNMVIAKLGELSKAGGINPQEHAAYVNAVHTMVKGDPKLYVMGSPQKAAPSPAVAPTQPVSPVAAQNPQPAARPLTQTPKVNWSSLRGPSGTDTNYPKNNMRI